MLSRIKHHRAASLAAGAIVVAALVSGSTAVANADAEQTNNANAKGGIANLEADGPYPGATQLQDGDNSTTKWANDGTLQQSWVMCATGKLALGGGFTAASDDTTDAKKDVQITGSQPTQVSGGNLVYNAIEGDADGSFVPNGWLVEGYNTGDHDVIVRPWVVCANILN